MPMLLCGIICPTPVEIDFIENFEKEQKKLRGK